MPDLADEIEALRRALREKHAADLAQINGLGIEQAAYQSELTHALEGLLAAHESRANHLATLITNVANRLGLARGAINHSNANVIEHEHRVKSDYRLELEQALQRRPN